MPACFWCLFCFGCFIVKFVFVFCVVSVFVSFGVDNKYQKS